MAANVIDDREQVHALVDSLAPHQVHAVRGLLETMVHPLAAVLANAPVDDEPVSDEERRDIEASRQWFQDNKGVPHDEAMRRLGLD